MVLATNIAESSITIPDVTTVVDFCLSRMMEFNDARQMPALVLKLASKACTKQRAGRAGRLRPGVCMRLLPRTTHALLADFPSPEMGRVPLENVVLTTRSLFAAPASVQQLLGQVVDPPPQHRVEATLRSLADIGALESPAGADPNDTALMQLTRLGGFAAAMPLDVRLSKLVRPLSGSYPSGELGDLMRELGLGLEGVGLTLPNPTLTHGWKGHTHRRAIEGKPEAKHKTITQCAHDSLCRMKP